MNQRGIAKKYLHLVMEHGDCNGDRISLSAKTAGELLEEMKQEAKALEAVMKKGGITIVVGDDRLITAYRTNSFSAPTKKKIKG